MGTSKRWIGADRARVWPEGDKALGAWSRTTESRTSDESVDDCGLSEEDAYAIGAAYLNDLRRVVQRDPGSDPLRTALLVVGGRLPAAIDQVSKSILAITADPEGVDTDQLAELTETFVKALDTGSRTLLNSILRRGAAQALQDVLRRMSADQAAEPVGRDAETTERSLFCMLYRLFFAHAVAQVVTTVIAEKVKLAIPVLYLLDPAGAVATWIAKHLFTLLPNPCAEKIDDGGSLKSLGEDLVRESVDHALGIDPTANEATGAI